MKVESGQLKAFILDAKLLTPEQIKETEKIAQKKQKSLEEVLLNEGLISEEKVIKLKAHILGIPFVNLEKEKISPEVLHIIPEPIARKYNIIAFKKIGRDLQVAMLNPEDLQTIEFIRKKTDLKILPRLTSPDSIKILLKQYQKTLKAEFGEIIRKQSKILKKEPRDGEELKKMAEDLPVIRIVDTLLKHAILQDASDIHIEPTEKEIIVRYRIDGILHDAMTLPKQVHVGVVARIKVLSNLKLDEHRLPQDGRFKIESEDYKISFRVSIMPIYDGEKVVMRLLPEDAKGFSLETLGFRGEQVEIIHQNIRKPYGMILATGPTGCGKTTTLYTIIEIINSPDVNIATIEDPIEYRIPRVNQTQVKPKIGLKFSSGLRALVRQDPDIIMVGEIRDNETAAMAVNAALTGHLLLSTLHTNNAAGAFPRLIDMKIEPFLIASTINMVIAQRLVRRLHADSKEKYHLSTKELQTLAKEFNLEQILKTLKKEKVVKPEATWEIIDFFRAKPSPDSPDGYKGRIGIHEVLEIHETIKKLITQGATTDEIQDQALKEGMITMLEDGFIKAVQGITSIEEILRVAKE